MGAFLQVVIGDSALDSNSAPLSRAVAFRKSRDVGAQQFATGMPVENHAARARRSLVYAA
jgi:hypothetical protein